MEKSNLLGFISTLTLKPKSLSTLKIFFRPTFFIISSVFEDQGEIVPNLGPT